MHLNRGGAAPVGVTSLSSHSPTSHIPTHTLTPTLTPPPPFPQRDGAVTSEVLFRRISAIEAAITSLDNPEHNRDALCAMDGRVAAMPVSRRTRRAVQRLPPPGVPPSHVALRVFGGLPEEGREAAGVVREALR